MIRTRTIPANQTQRERTRIAMTTGLGTSITPIRAGGVAVCLLAWLLAPAGLFVVGARCCNIRPRARGQKTLRVAIHVTEKLQKAGRGRGLTSIPLNQLRQKNAVRPHL